MPSDGYMDRVIQKEKHVLLLVVGAHAIKQGSRSRLKDLKFLTTDFLCLCVVGIVHENVKMGSDGESDHASGTSSDEVQSPVRVRMRNNHHRRISNEV